MQRLGWRWLALLLFLQPLTTMAYAQAATLDAAGQRVALADTWGAISYGYDGAGRLVGASYPDGASETYTYDPAGNRVGSTRTDAGGVTTTTTAGFDAADQLLTSSAVTGGAAPVVTGYGYDGNGNQTSSAGPAGTTANTFNAQDQLVRQQGPGTDLALVYDGQGDRLRSVEASGPLPVRRDEARDLVGGLSGLVSDGQADYAYLAPGSGMAPLSRYDRQAARGTYLGTDLLGSVRLATDPTGTAIGAGAYDAWGNARAYAGPDGATQLAGLRAAVPFGYAGQQYDQGPGTYAMRARTYDPATGRFQSVDPLLDQTGQPYQYAGDSPTGSTDPSGQARDIGTAGYVMGVDVFDGSTKSHYLQGQFRQAITRAFVQSDGTGGSFWNARASQQPYGDLTNSDVPHADLISFAPWHDLEGRAVAEIYNIVPDYYANNESNGLWMPGINDQGNPFADVSNFYPNDVQALKSLQRYAAAGGQVYYQGPPRTRDACVRRAPSLLIGRSYPAPLGVALAAPSGPQFAPVTPYAGPYRGWGGDASGQYAHYLVANVAGTAYHLFPRLLGSGLVGYSVCQPGSPESTLDWGPLHLNQYRSQCENPGPHGHQDACAFGGPAQAPLCALDLFVGGVGSAYARCGQDDTACHALAGAPIVEGILINALPFAAGRVLGAVGDIIAFRAAGGIGTVEELRAAVDRAAANPSGLPVAHITKDGVSYAADWGEIRALLDNLGSFPAGTSSEDHRLLGSALRVLAASKTSEFEYLMLSKILFGLKAGGGPTLQVEFRTYTGGDSGVLGEWLGPGRIAISRDPGLSPIQRAATIIHEGNHDQIMTSLVRGLDQDGVAKIVSDRILTGANLPDEASAFWAEIEWANSNEFSTYATTRLKDGPSKFWRFLKNRYEEAPRSYPWGLVSDRTFRQIAKKYSKVPQIKD